MKLGNRLTHSIFLAILLLAFLLCLTACQESTSSKYERANKLLTEGKYTEAAAIFDEISTYEDASKMSLYTKAINAAETGDYDTAFTTFASLGEFKDCSMMITYYMGRQIEASVYDGARIYGNKWFDAIELYESIPLFRDSKDRAENCRKAAYDQAIKSGDEGDTSFAISILKELGTYSDAAKQVTYYQAVALLKKGDYSGTSRAFGSIPGFRDADDRVTSVLEDGYKVAAAKEEAGELDKAHAIYLNLGNYKDSAERAYKLYYDAGITRREAGDWNGAISAFTKAGKYSDAPEQIKETTYQEASALEAAGDQESAYQLFISLGEYKDSFERANKPFYELGVAKRDAQEWDAAKAAFEHAGTYGDAAEQIKETIYLEATALQQEGKYEDAIASFEALNGFSDSAAQITETKYLQAIALTAKGDYAEAVEIMIKLKGYKDVDTLLENDDNLAAAREAKLASYKTIGNYVTFGTYQQTITSYDQTAIEWLVLDYDEANHKALLLSRYGLDAVPYNKEFIAITWEQCTLRAWLNDDFLNRAFSEKEQSAILVTKVDNSSGQGYSSWLTSGGKNTQDRIFLLSCAEANRYLGVTHNDLNNLNNTKSRVAPTDYAVVFGAYRSDIYQTADGEPTGFWWLRSPGNALYNAAIVTNDGSLNYDNVNFYNNVVRPAFWLNLESDFF